MKLSEQGNIQLDKTDSKTCWFPAKGEIEKINWFHSESAACLETQSCLYTLNPSWHDQQISILWCYDLNPQVIFGEAWGNPVADDHCCA